MRFMIKAEMNEVKPVRWLIQHTKHDSGGPQCRSGRIRRRRGVGYARGELVGVYPEATISRSFELKEFKTGAVRMALEAHVPIVPLIVWGAHRMWTKDHPKALGRNKFPITVSIGEPIQPDGTIEELLATMRTEMNRLLHRSRQTTRIRRGRSGCHDGWAAARRHSAEARSSRRPNSPSGSAGGRDES